MSSAVLPDPVNKSALRQVLGCFPTGVTIVTAADAGKRPVGFTANSFTSVSLEPPLVLVCIAHRAGSHGAFARATHFGINILASDQCEMASVFASRVDDRFASGRWSTSAHGVPLLDDGAAWLECETHRQLDAGDHMLLIGRVLASGTAARPPLAFWSGAYASVAMLPPPAAPSQSRITMRRPP